MNALVWLKQKIINLFRKNDWDLCPEPKTQEECILQLEEICARHVAYQYGMMARVRNLPLTSNPFYKPYIEMTTEMVVQIIAWQNGWEDADKAMEG